MTGVLILLLAFLYMMKSCADCACVGGKRYVRRTKRAGQSQPDEENAAVSPSGAGDSR